MLTGPSAAPTPVSTTTALDISPTAGSREERTPGRSHTAARRAGSWVVGGMAVPIVAMRPVELGEVLAEHAGFAKWLV
jgi:hypothetical protein